MFQESTIPFDTLEMETFGAGGGRPVAAVFRVGEDWTGPWGAIPGAG